MVDDSCTVHWDGGQAVVTLPEHIGASNAGQVRDTLLSVINLGASTVIADMTATESCDHAGADAVVRAWQRTVSSGTELRLVVTAAIRDNTWTDRLDDLAVLARDAAATRREHLRLLDAIVTGLFHAGLGLQAAEGLPADAARRSTGEVASELDDIIGQIRAAAFAEPGPPPPRGPGEDQ